MTLWPKVLKSIFILCHVKITSLMTKVTACISSTRPILDFIHAINTIKADWHKHSDPKNGVEITGNLL